MEGSLGFLFAALAVVWLVIVGYLVMLSGRVSSLQRDVERLKQQDADQIDEDDERDRSDR